MNMARRVFLACMVALPFAATLRLRPKLFAIVYVKGTKELRRIYDTFDDETDAHIYLARRVLADDEIMEGFPTDLIKDYRGLLMPDQVISLIGKGVIL